MLAASDIVIDTEFAALIPPLSTEERVQLMANIERDGFRDPVVVWLGHQILVDGHNRIDIWQTAYNSDPDRAPDIVEKTFKDRDDARAWIIRNQLGRRNLTDAQRVQLALMLEPELRKQAKENQQIRKGKQRGTSCQKSDNLRNEHGMLVETVDVKREIAKAAGVSHDTVAKVSKVLSNGTPELQGAMLAGSVSVNTAAKAASLPTAKQSEVVKAAAESSSPKKAAAKAVKSVATVTTEEVEARKWDVMDDCSKIRSLFLKLYDNWEREEDKVIIRQLFRQLAKEV